MQQGWEELSLAQQQWEECLNQEHAERDRHLRDLAERAGAVAGAEQALAVRQHEWEQAEVVAHAPHSQELPGAWWLPYV